MRSNQKPTTDQSPKSPQLSGNTSHLPGDSLCLLGNRTYWGFFLGCVVHLQVFWKSGISQNIDFHLDRWDPEGTGIHLRGYGQDLHALRGGLQSEGDVAQTWRQWPRPALTRLEPCNSDTAKRFQTYLKGDYLNRESKSTCFFDCGWPRPGYHTGVLSPGCTGIADLSSPGQGCYTTAIRPAAVKGQQGVRHRGFQRTRGSAHEATREGLSRSWWPYLAGQT